MTRHNRSRWQGHGHKPAPAPAPLIGFWGVLAMIVVYGLGIAGILWLALHWLQVALHIWESRK